MKYDMICNQIKMQIYYELLAGLDGEVEEDSKSWIYSETRIKGSWTFDRARLTGSALETSQVAFC